MNLLHYLLEGTFTVAGGQVLVREVLGNLFGLASAIGGMRRQTWAWPVGILGNLILFTVFVGGVLAKPEAHDLWGQAGRQVFFGLVSVYGWWRWRQARRRNESSDGAISPRWAGAAGRLQMVAFAIVGTAVFYVVLKALGSWGPLSDAWILTGSILATYGMARGWTEFWLTWIAVDVVGVPLLLAAGYYPSASMYIVYGAFCLWGFGTWLRVQRQGRPTQPLEAAGIATGEGQA